MKELMMNYFKNSGKIQTDLSGIRACTENYNACGYDVGQIIQLLLDWSI